MYLAASKLRARELCGDTLKLHEVKIQCFLNDTPFRILRAVWRFDGSFCKLLQGQSVREGSFLTLLGLLEPRHRRFGLSKHRWAVCLSHIIMFPQIWIFHKTVLKWSQISHRSIWNTFGIKLVETYKYCSNQKYNIVIIICSNNDTLL